MEEGTNGYLTADKLQGIGSRDVTISTGDKVRIRRLSPSGLMQALGHLVELSKLEAKDIRKQIETGGGPNPGQAFESIGRVLLAGVATPKLVEDPTVGPTPGDFPIEDQVVLFQEILDLSGLTKEKAAAVHP